MRGVELQYGLEPRRIRRRWWACLLLAVSAVALFYYFGLPLVRRADVALRTYRMRQDLAACMAYSFPQDVIAYSEGSPPTAKVKTPWDRLEKSLSRVTGIANSFGDGIVFVGQRFNAAGEPRLVIVSASGDPQMVQLRMQLIDPGNGKTLPKLLTFKAWHIVRRGKTDRKLTLHGGKPDSRNLDELVIPMRYGERDSELKVSIGVDYFALSGGSGWRDHLHGPFWVLEEDEVELVEHVTEPRTVELFDKRNLVVTPALAMTDEGELVGASLGGIQSLRLDAPGSVRKALATANWPAHSGIADLWQLEMSRGGSQVYVGDFSSGFPAIFSVRTGVVGPNIEVPKVLQHDAAFSPDGKQIFVTAVRLGTAAFDTETGRQIWRKQITGSTISVAGGKVAVTNGWMRERSSVRVLSADDGQIVQQIPIRNSFERASLSPDGNRLSVTGDHGWSVVKLSDLSTEFRAPVILDQSEPVWSPDGELIAAVGKRFVYVWDLRPPQAVYRLPISNPSAFGSRLIFTPDGKHLILATSGQTGVLIWEMKDVRKRQPASGSPPP